MPRAAWKDLLLALPVRPALGPADPPCWWIHHAQARELATVARQVGVVGVLPHQGVNSQSIVRLVCRPKVEKRDLGTAEALGVEPGGWTGTVRELAQMVGSSEPEVKASLARLRRGKAVKHRPSPGAGQSGMYRVWGTPADWEVV